MARFTVRNLCSEDFVALRQLEAEVFGAAGDDVLCPHYLRLCTELFANMCYLALVDRRPVGDLLCFVRDPHAYCPTLTVRPDLPRTSLNLIVSAESFRALVHRVDVCRFTVTPEKGAARALL